MTRFARSSDFNKKKPLDASKWEELTEKKLEKTDKQKTKLPKPEQSLSDAPTDSNNSKDKVKKVKNKIQKTAHDKAHHSDGKEKFPNSSSWKNVKKGGQWTDAKERHVAKVFKQDQSREHRRVARIEQRQAEKVTIWSWNWK